MISDDRLYSRFGMILSMFEKVMNKDFSRPSDDFEISCNHGNPDNPGNSDNLGNSDNPGNLANPENLKNKFPGKEISALENEHQELKRNEVVQRGDAVEQDDAVEKDDPRLFMTMEQLESDVMLCERCSLSVDCKTEGGRMFGYGCKYKPSVVAVVGKRFNSSDDSMLKLWLSHISLTTEKNLYICPLSKCSQSEGVLSDSQECLFYVKQQIALLKPDAVICVGVDAYYGLTGRPAADRKADNGETEDAVCGKILLYDNRYPLVVVNHPADVQKAQGDLALKLKLSVWNVLKKLAQLIKLEIVR